MDSRLEIIKRNQTVHVDANANVMYTTLRHSVHYFTRGDLSTMDNYNNGYISCFFDSNHGTKIVLLCVSKRSLSCTTENTPYKCTFSSPLFVKNMTL